MSGLPINKDVMYMIINYISISDLIRLSMTCKTMLAFVADNNRLWTNILFDMATKAESLSYFRDQKLDPYQAKEIVAQVHRFKYNKEGKECYVHTTVDDVASKMYLLRRLEQPVSSKQYLRFFMKVSTYGVPGSSFILCGNVISYANFTPQPGRRKTTFQSYEDDDDTYGHSDTFYVRFKHTTNPTFLIWEGEGGKNSASEFYAVDRLRSGANTMVDISDISSKHWHQSILGKADYKHVGKILYDSEDHYQGLATTKQNHTDSHSQTRRIMGTNERLFGTNSTTIDYPFIRVNSYTHVDVRMTTNDLMELFGLNAYTPKFEK